jgi:hypothetical protein
MDLTHLNSGTWQSGSKCSHPAGLLSPLLQLKELTGNLITLLDGSSGVMDMCKKKSGNSCTLIAL